MTISATVAEAALQAVLSIESTKPENGSSQEANGC